MKTRMLHASHCMYIHIYVRVVSHTLQNTRFPWFHPHRFHREVLALKVSTYEEPQSVFIAGQLFSILESMDFTDEVGRFVILVSADIWYIV